MGKSNLIIKPKIKYMPEEKKNPIQILIDAVQVANRRGAFELLESAQIAAAVIELTQPIPEPEKPKENGILVKDIVTVE